MRIKRVERARRGKLTTTGASDHARDSRRRRKLSNKAASWLILLSLLVGAVVCFTLERTLASQEGLTKELIHAVGEAFAVAFLLGVCGDFYLKRKLGEESVKRGVQGALGETLGFLEPGQPQALRAAVLRFASRNVYIRQSLWRINFNWANEEKTLVKLDVSLKLTGVSLAHDGYLPKRTLWSLASVRGYNTTYLGYSLQCPNAGINVAEETEDLIPFLSERTGKVRLNQEALLGDRLSEEQKVPLGESFTHNRAACMYQSAVSWIPLMHNDFALSFKLELGGDALSSLSVSVFHPTSEMTDQDWTYLGEESAVTSKQWDFVTPGQATIVSWLPRGYRAVDFRPERPNGGAEATKPSVSPGPPF